jgi:hypothetical protein
VPYSAATLCMQTQHSLKMAREGAAYLATGFELKAEHRTGFSRYLTLLNGPLSGEKFFVLRACIPAL